MEMDHYKKAAHHWWEALQAMVINAGYTKYGGDGCVLILRQGDSATHIATTVDDCFCIVSDPMAKEKEKKV